MHAEAYGWVKEHAPSNARTVLDIGGRNINGSTRDLFPAAEVYRTLDILPGEDVDVVADAGTWEPDRQYEVVVCTEVFEHTANWPAIVRTAYVALEPGGLFVATMAGPGRPAHSAIDGGWSLHPGEHYGNVGPMELSVALHTAGFIEVLTDQRDSPADTRCRARRPA